MQRNLLIQAGILFILGSLLLITPYIALTSMFDYPDILRMPAEYILSKFHDGGTKLILVWLMFALAGLPLFWSVIYLRKLIGDEHQLVRVATTMMIIGGIAQIAGLLRWVFVVPVLAKYYRSDPEAAGEIVPVVFDVVHQYGGVLLGEHLGQLFSIIWTIIVGLHFVRSKFVHPWIGWFGLTAALIYLLGQTELFATVIPSVPVIGWAAPVGSSLWLLWMIILGTQLIRMGSVLPSASTHVYSKKGLTES